MAALPIVLVVSDGQMTSPLWGASRTQPLNIILETNPARALERWAEVFPHLLVLDIDSKPLALELIPKLRAQVITPLLLLSSIHEDNFMLEAYQAGIDEYISKPLHPALFHAKLKAWLRRSWSAPFGMHESLNVGNVTLIPKERTLQFEGQAAIPLTKLEMRLLHCLLGRHGYPVTTEELCQRLWPNSAGDVIRLKNVIYRLRRKLEKNPAYPRYLLTVTGVGYQFNLS